MTQSDNSVFVIYRDGNVSVEKISRKLKIQPDSVSEVDGNGKNSFWKLFCKNNTLPLEDQIESWVNLLSSKVNELEELKEEGWLIELDCLIQPEEGVGVISLEPELLMDVSRLHAILTIRIWD
jgi:hypothetical protein